MLDITTAYIAVVGRTSVAAAEAAVVGIHNPAASAHLHIPSAGHTSAAVAAVAVAAVRIAAVIVVDHNSSAAAAVDATGLRGRWADHRIEKSAATRMVGQIDRLEDVVEAATSTAWHSVEPTFSFEKFMRGAV